MVYRVTRFNEGANCTEFLRTVTGEYTLHTDKALSFDSYEKATEAAYWCRGAVSF